MTGPRNVISPKEGDELKNLYTEYAKATAIALAALLSDGMESRRFFEADLAAGKISARIREILGLADPRNETQDQRAAG